MDPGLRLKLAPERHLAMTFALRQALEILQMPQLELAQWLGEEIEKNPLLQEIPTSKKTFDCDELASPVSLYDHLMRQIRECFSLSDHRQIAEEFLEHLDEKGFLTTPIEDLALRLRTPIPQLETILANLQTFDPPGIFARNLQEALLLQLKAQGEVHAPSFHLIQDCFDDLIHGRYATIKKKMGPIDLSTAIQKLSRLRLRPSEAFGETFKSEPNPVTVADLRIVQTELGWTIETSDEELPKFQISAEYEAVVPQSAEEKESLRGWSTAAKWLMRSLKRRRQILVQIGAFLIRKQAPYLSQKGNLRPLALQDLATHLHLHESTLSRALAGKYAETPRGLIPLRALITSYPETGQAKEALAQLITEENKKNPLTDDQFATILRSKGYKVARRTVAKYRKELKIGLASARKYVR